MKRVTKRTWREFNDATESDLDLRFDWPRRMHNALLALSRMDPGWIEWVEHYVPLNLSITQQTRIIERRARVLTCEGHSFSHGQWISIVYSDTPFSERGLTPC